MINPLHVSVMGMNAMGTRISAAANNVANASTDGFKKDRVTLEAKENGGVSTVVGKVDTPGPVIEDRGTTRELSNVDLAEELVSTIPTQGLYTANVRMIQTQDEMTGTLLDIKK